MDRKNADEKTDTYYPDGGYGWVVVGAIILINVSLLTLVQCFGIIFRDEFKAWGVTSAETSFLLHLQSSLFCVSGFFTSPFLKAYGMRPVAFFGAFLMCVGICLSSFASSYLYLIFSLSILTGIGQGTIMPATYLATYTYFKKRLTIATSLSVTGASLSPIFMPKICDILLSQFGRKYTVLFLFAISLLSFVSSYLLKPVKKGQCKQEESFLEEAKNEENNEIKQEEEVAQELLSKNGNINKPIYQTTTVPVLAKKLDLKSKLFDAFDLHLLKDIPFVLVVIGLGVSFASELNIILMMQFILRELSLFDRSQVATAVSVQSILDIIGRLVVPMVGHWFDVSPKIMYSAALIMASFGRTVLAIMSREQVIVYICVALIGLTKGCRAVFQSVILPKFVPLEKIAAANGLNMLFTGGVSLIIGPLIGVVHDGMGSYEYALHAASILSLLCVALWIVEHIRSKIRNRKSQSAESEGTS